ncbi:flagellin [Thalassotalea euphylliae]|uniref:Flagellin n=1 Tax=Thalassotalea euphylliae TaxID=1655234 RepID=A0A3E0UBX7_9GAMM|nr:flagellin [Thalassotalea euphylliae]REL34376.1 flagellin [Thalassotalea euphylliae]
MFVNTNTSALNAINQLNTNANRLEKSYEALSSGKRINSAADDAAGLQISVRLTAQSNALTRIEQNINDGISYAQVAEGALAEVSNMAQRMYQLAIQAANGSLTTTDKQALDVEFQGLKQEINRIANETEIFGRFPLLGGDNVPSLGDIFPISGGSGTFSSGIRSFAAIPAGSNNISLTLDSLGLDDDIQIFTQDGRHLVGTDLNDNSWQNNADNIPISTPQDVENNLFTPPNGFPPGASYDASNLNSGGPVYSPSAANSTSYNGMTISFGGDGDRTSPADGNNDGVNTGGTLIEAVHIDTTTEPLYVAVVGSGSFDLTVNYSNLGNTVNNDEPFKVFVATTPDGNNDDFIDIEKTASSSVDLGIAPLTIASASGAQTAISALQNALNTIAGYRSEYGASINVLSSAARTSMNSHENIVAATSRIQDTDYASETAKLAREQVLQQASQSILSQANIQPELALSLLNQ